MLLTREGTLLEMRDCNDWTALIHAAHHKRLNTIKLLLQRGADVNAASHKLCTALMEAAENNDIAIAQLLLDHVADSAVTDDNGYNALFRAADKGHVSMMRTLIQHGLSVQTVDSEGHTLLMMAATAGHRRAVEWLLQQGVPVNAVTNLGYTALHHVCRSSSRDDATTIKLLLANGANPHKCKSLQMTALDAAAVSGNVQCARVLISAGADVNHLNSMNVTSLHVATKEHRAAVVQLLLDHGATAVMNSVVLTKCLKACCDSATALMMCTEADTVKLLLAAGADVQTTNNAGDTCLHAAAKHN
jgi:uncharacterized protein